MPVITILSGKGGVGKSTLAMGLGQWISKLKSDQNVLLIDGDLNVSTIRFKMCRRPKATLADVLAGRRTLREALHQCDLEDKRTRLPPMRAGPYRSLISIARNLDEMMRELRKIFSFMIVDTPATISIEHMILAGIADGALYVIDPAHESIEVVLGAARDLEKWMGVPPIGAVLNNLPPGTDERDWIRKTGRIASVLGVIPEDKLLKETFMRDIPVTAEHPNSRSSLAMREISEKLLGIKIERTAVSPKFRRALLGVAESLK